MDDQSFEKCLEILNQEETLSNSVYADNALNDLTRVFQSDINSVEVCSYVTKALDIEDGIPKYVTSALTRGQNNDQNAVTKKAFNLINFIASNFSSAVDLVTPKLIPWCLRILHSDKPNDIKASVINFSVTLAQNCPCLKVDWHEVFSKVQSFFSVKSEITPTIICSLLTLLGLLCELNPEVACDYKDWLFNYILRKITSNGASNQLLEACFNGLQGLLVNFPPNNEGLTTIYKKLDEFTTKKDFGMRNTAQRAALKVFIRHASYFDQNIYASYSLWHKKLLSWLESTSEHKRLAISALSKFYNIISNTLISLPTLNQDTETFLHFKNYFEARKCNNDIYCVKELFAGLSEFAVVFKLRSEVATLEKIVNRISGDIFVRADENVSMLVIQLEGTSKIYSALTDRLPCCDLPKLAVKTMEGYPRVDTIFQPFYLDSLTESFCAWLKCGMELQLEAVIYQGLLRSSDFPIYADIHLLEHSAEKGKVVSYKNFLSLWTHLLSNRQKSDEKEDQRRVTHFIYSSFIKSFLKIIKKLDLEIDTLTNEESDPALAMEAKRPEDFQIFVNIVDIFQDLIPKTDTNRLLEWIPKILYTSINLAQDSPLVSGFLKVIATCLQVMHEHDSQLESREEEMLADFVENVINRIHTQKEDLLIASLKLVLQAPVSILSPFHERLGHVLISAIIASHGLPDLLSLCIDALERWYSYIPAEQMNAIVEEVLPSLTSTLLNPVNERNDLSIETNKKGNILNLRGKYRKRVVEPNDRKLVVLQKQLLLFMAKLEPRLCLLEPSIQNHFDGGSLSYILRLRDARLNLNLITIAPRVMDLALLSGDRDTRVTACELLYIFIMFAVERRSDSNLFRQMFKISLSLSCDTVPMIKEMFSPLAMQITRFFAEKDDKVASLLVEVLFSTLSHTHDLALRDFSASCLKIFVQQSSSTECNKVLMQICDQAIDPDRGKRVGAAVVFNKIYTIIREDRRLLNLEWLQLYHAFLVSLEMSVNEEDAQLVNVAVLHIQRPFLEQAAMYISCPNGRKIPPGFLNGTLKDIAIASYKHCHSTNQILRKTTQTFVKELIPKLPEKQSFHLFYHENLKSLENHEVDLQHGDWVVKCEAIIDVFLWFEENGVLPSTEFKEKCISLAERLLKLYKTSSPTRKNMIAMLTFLKVTHELLTSTAVDNLAHLLIKGSEKSVLSNSACRKVCLDLLNTLKNNQMLWVVFQAQLPDFSEENLINLLKSSELEILFPFLLCLDIMDETNSLTGEYCGDNIIFPLIENLFTSMGRMTICRNLSRHYLQCFRKVLLFAIKNSLSVQCLLEFITDTSAENEVSENGGKTTKGRYFFKLFRSDLVNFLVSSHETSRFCIMLKEAGFDLIKECLRHISLGGYCKVTQEGKKKFKEKILDDWDDWIKVVMNRKQLFTLLKLLADAEGVKNGCFKEFKLVRKWFIQTPLLILKPEEGIIEFFELLPHFLAYEDGHNPELIESLSEVIKRQWLLPGSSSLLDQGTLNIVYEKVLSCIMITGSLVVIRFAAESFDGNQVTQEMMKMAMTKVAAMSENHVLEVIEVLWDLLLTVLVDKLSISFVTKLLTNLLEASSKNIVIKFCEKHSVDIAEMLVQNNLIRVERDLSRKMMAANLLQVIYMKTKQEDRSQVETVLNQKGIFKKCILSCKFNYFKNSCSTSNEKELLRKMHCRFAQFLCLMVTSIPENSKDDKIYNLLLFQLKDLWESLVDESRVYQFGVEFAKLPKRRKVEAAIGRTRSDIEGEARTMLNYANSYRSVLFESTLSEDVRNFDLSHADVLSSNTEETKNKMVLDLEMDELNQHEIMPDMCALIRHLIEEGKQCWLNSFIDRLKNSPSTNVKLLILKMIYNLDNQYGIIQQYDEKLAPVILQIIRTIFERSPVNYFAIDLINMLIRWNSLLTNQGNTLVKLVQWFVEKINSTRRDIVKFVFVNVRGMVEKWRHLLNSSELVSFLLARIKFVNHDIDDYVNLQFTSLLLANDLLPGHLPSAQCLLKWLEKIILANNKNSLMAAEACGMLLRNFKDEELEILKKEIFCCIQRVQKKVIVLHPIHKFYPTIVSSFIPALLNTAWHDRSVHKQQSLELILTHVKIYDSLADDELSTSFPIFALDVLKCNIDDAQEYMLKIILHVFSVLEDDSVFKVAPEVVKLSENANPKLRDLSSELLMKILARFKKPKLNDAKIIENCEVALLARMNDDDPKIQKHCIDFWYEAHKSDSMKGRFLYILDELFKPDVEQDFVEFTCKLILHSASMANDYRFEIFDHSLADCTYSELNLHTYLTVQSSLAPLFAPSLTAEATRLIKTPLASISQNKAIAHNRKTLLFAATVNSSLSTSSSSSEGNEFKKPSQPRPYRFTSQPSGFFAKKAAEASQQEKAKEEERRIQKDTKATLLRSYRDGKYPDIRVTNEEFLIIISALIGKDRQFARELLTCLVTGIFKEEDNQNFRDQVLQSFNKLLKLSRGDNTHLIRGVFDIAITHKLPLIVEDLSRLARSSGLLSMGTILLEMSFSDEKDDSPCSAKKRRCAEDSASDKWLLIASLYNSMNDKNAVRGIFLDKLQISGSAKYAINEEAASNWDSATSHFENIFKENEDSVERRHFYNQSYLSCLAHLSDWDKLSTCVELSAPGEKLWEEPWCLEVLLPWYLRSKKMVSLSAESDMYQQYIKECIQNPKKATTVAKFPEKLAVGYWLNGDTAKAISSVHQALMMFLSKWSSISTWDIQIKKNMLRELEIISEVQCIVNILSSKSQCTALNKMIQGASRSLPSNTSDLLTWDVRLCIRNRFCTYLRENGSDVSLLENNLINSYLALANAALDERNITLGRKCLLLTQKMPMDTSQSIQWRHTRRLVEVVNEKKRETGSLDKMKKYLSLWEKTEESVAAIMDTDFKFALQAQMKLTILRVIREMINESEQAQIEQGDLQFLPLPKQNLKQNWMDYAQSTIEGLDKDSQKGEVYVQLVKFYKKYFPLTHWEDIIKALLKAMKCGNREARELFGVVFNKDGLESSAVDWLELKKCSDEVPTWMFLLWRHQLIAHLKNNPTDLIKHLLMRVAQDYPGSLSHSLRISKETLTVEERNQYFIQDLSLRVLSNNVDEAFVQAVGKLANPLIKMKYFLRNIDLGLQETPPDWENVRKNIDGVSQLMADASTSINYKVLEHLRAETGKLGKFEDASTLTTVIKKINSAISIAEQSYKMLNKLGSFSPWLSDFRWSQMKECLEVPGQYDGDSEPRVKNHVKVVAFQEDLIILNSKQQPMKLTIVGNDAKQYSFLVKFGEDLRQDERIQQVLSQIQNKLRADKATKDFILDGFSVIPFTTSWGLIQWVESAKTLSAMMTIPPETLERVHIDNFYFLDPKARHPMNPMKVHLNGYLNKTHEQVAAEFERRVAAFDKDALRSGLWRLSTCAEHFLKIRSNFVVSFSVMNIVNWVLGVGDRHLDNILVTESGRVLGIDYGIAFEFATQFLPLPELVPFRLTPQILNVLNPLRESGWVKQTMVHTLRVLREDPSVLLARLEVFVLEPSLDWVHKAKKLARDDFHEHITFQKCLPAAVVKAVQNKLSGDNPVACLKSSLKITGPANPCIEQQMLVLSGHPGHIRYIMPKQGLTPEQQVDCLLDLAMDPTILGFTWTGWSPWL